MTMLTTPPTEAAILDAVRGGDQGAFAALAERHRRQLHVHCYRMLGSFEDAEDMVQEAFLRAWNGRKGFEGRSRFSTWLYRIATNVCLDALARTRRRFLPADVAPATREASPEQLQGILGGRDDDGTPRRPRSEIAWLQPYPDHLLEPTAPSEDEPDAVVASRETIELVYLAAIQHLPPRQRAVLVVRDALGWSAKETAALLDASVASVNSALQRARATMRALVPAGRLEWAAPRAPAEEERAVLQRFVEAVEAGDAVALATLLHEDARLAMPPATLWFDGRASVVSFILGLIGPGAPGRFRMLPARSNRQPAVASYFRLHGEPAYRLCGLKVLRIESDRIAEIVNFGPELCGAFGLAPSLHD